MLTCKTIFSFDSFLSSEVRCSISGETDLTESLCSGSGKTEDMPYCPALVHEAIVTVDISSSRHGKPMAIIALCRIGKTFENTM